jgi:hypothetical protein
MFNVACVLNVCYVSNVFGSQHRVCDCKMHNVLYFDITWHCRVRSLGTLKSRVWKGLIFNDALAVLDKTNGAGDQKEEVLQR